MTWLLMAALLAGAGLLAAAETAVFSLQPAERRRLAQRHAAVEAVLQRPSSLLVALLLGNLLVTVGYFSVGAGVALELVAQHRSVAAAVFTVVSLLLLVVAGEILPKTLALAAPGALVTVMAAPLLLLRLLLWPLVVAGEAASHLITTLLLGGRASAVAPVADDFKSAVAHRASFGTYHAHEVALLHDVVDFGGLRARNLMTPRVDVVFLDVRQPLAAWIATLARRPFAVYPVCDGKPDRLLGLVYAADVLAHPEADPRTLLRPALFAPLPLDAERLVARMQEEDSRLAVLLDEHGGVAGVVGLGALSRAVLGEIEGLSDAAAAGVRRVRPDLLLVRGDCPLRVLREEGGVELPARRAGTVAGAVTEALGRVPRRGDELTLPGLRLRVAAVRGRRVELVALRSRAGAVA
jgi:CBS domain containing-hemolysin-like protein